VGTGAVNLWKGKIRGPTFEQTFGEESRLVTSPLPVHIYLKWIDLIGFEGEGREIRRGSDERHVPLCLAALLVLCLRESSYHASHCISRKAKGSKERALCTQGSWRLLYTSGFNSGVFLWQAS
jgi:hypothetical protein